mmetsp:Transcript_10627/g.19280  ORF Transcript_10627/g.19280 Transcript_10627/m.19280 type:complete len:269 (-) Transcript_10627:1844-2650(-)
MVLTQSNAREAQLQRMNLTVRNTSIRDGVRRETTTSQRRGGLPCRICLDQAVTAEGGKGASISSNSRETVVSISVKRRTLIPYRQCPVALQGAAAPKTTAANTTTINVALALAPRENSSSWNPPRNARPLKNSDGTFARRRMYPWKLRGITRCRASMPNLTPICTCLRRRTGGSFWNWPTWRNVRIWLRMRAVTTERRAGYSRGRARDGWNTASSRRNVGIWKDAQPYCRRACGIARRTKICSSEPSNFTNGWETWTRRDICSRERNT